MKNRIIICGGNGAGKTSLGYALSKNTRIPFFDIEDYYFPDKTEEYVYDTPKSKSEVIEMLISDLLLHEEFLLAAVNPNIAADIVGRYTVAIYINVPKDIRVKRVKDRSYEKFGQKIMLGGELHDKEKAFFRLVEARSEDKIKEWLSKSSIPTIELDGTKPISENVEYLTQLLTAHRKE